MFDVVRISDEKSDTAPCGEVRRAQFRSTADRSAAYCSAAERSDLFGRLCSTVKKSNAVQPLSALLQEDPMAFSTAFCYAAESVVRRHPFGRPGLTLCHVCTWRIQCFSVAFCSTGEISACCPTAVAQLQKKLMLCGQCSTAEYHETTMMIDPHLLHAIFLLLLASSMLGGSCCGGGSREAANSRANCCSSE